jgi:hypothetical protein
MYSFSLRHLLTFLAAFRFQTDAHMDFVPSWDTKMLAMWASTDNEYAILSTYVSDMMHMRAEINGFGLNGIHEVPHLCMLTFRGMGGMPRNWGTKVSQKFIDLLYKPYLFSSFLFSSPPFSSVLPSSQPNKTQK